MQAPSRYAALFEPLRIGPKVAPNRFYQVPHCTGMGYMAPKTVAAMRATKAEGGWGVVSTEYCSIHPSSDDSPYAFLTLWDDEDVRALAKTAEVIQKGGALAALELWHGGFHSNNRLTREPLLAPGHFSAEIIQPGAARAMDLDDIRKVIGWQKDAARRAVMAGFDIVYVYASHDYLPFQFLSRRFNQRRDAYGGSLENRARLLRQMIEATREGVGDKAAVAVRLAVDEQQGPEGFSAEGEGRAVVEMLAELPDLWDVNLGGAIANDSRSARFSSEAFQEDFVRFVKKVTSKPVVGVGRFTSPDTMLRQIKDGILDFIGAARPSIADPFLPLKIKEGREDEIRECIGCNICRSANNLGVPLRCTQNPTIGEGWRRGWHPEKIEPRHGNQTVLVVGGGPAGLEAARALGQRGYRVTLCEKDRTLGGRLIKESSLPGLSTWIRVRDWRETMIGKLENVEVFRESALSADDVRQVGADHVLLATGASWRRDGLGARNLQPLTFAKDVLTPDDVFAGAALEKDLLIYDDEHFVMAGALAERLALAGHRVIYLSSEPIASSWTVYTDDQHFIQKRLIDLGVRLVLSQRLIGAADGKARLACAYSGRESALDYGSLILATGRVPCDELACALADLPSLRLIGDCRQPSSVADAVYSGHRAARELGATNLDQPPKRERPDA